MDSKQLLCTILNSILQGWLSRWSKCLEPRGRMQPRVREIPPQIQKTGVISQPVPWGRLIESCLRCLFFKLSFLVGEAGELRKERRFYQEGNAFRVSKCQRQYLPCSWHADEVLGLQSVTYNSSTVWTPAESPRSHLWPCITLRVKLLGPQRNWAAQSF